MSQELYINNGNEGMGPLKLFSLHIYLFPVSVIVGNSMVTLYGHHFIAQEVKFNAISEHRDLQIIVW